MPSATAPSPSARSSPPVSRTEDARGTGFGVYVHWPFCLSKCPYCDFNSHVREDIDEARWRAALLADLDHAAQLTPGRAVTSVFFGGGTPSLMHPDTAAAVIDRIRALWRTAPDLEITLEANPGAAEAERFAGLADAGVNRLSLGIQSLVDDALAFLGRIHDRTEALAAIERAQRQFSRMSFDLIYGRPGQTVAEWRAELDEAIALAGDHLSAYQLTIEPGTAFPSQARLGALKLPDEAVLAALYDATQDALAGAGLPAYEISNHARAGSACRHNLTYWRYGEYAGAGPGAHGRLRSDAGRLAVTQHRLPERWLAAVEEEGHGTCDTAVLDAGVQREEMVMMGLRLADGLGRSDLEAELGLTIEQAFDAAVLDRLADGGFIECDDRGLRATAAGWRRLDAVLAALLA